jgi:uncharacterized protein YndB with AHSA1/START domain
MAEDSVSATMVINASAAEIFALLADPETHADVDGTGWVRGTAASEPLTAAGQIFRMRMYHPRHPDGNYVTANRVQDFDPPSTISWETGYDADDGTVRFGGWKWRYDLTPDGTATTTVTLTYDWSAASESTRKRIGFPPFPPEHLPNSLAHLAQLVTAGPNHAADSTP